MSNPVPNTFPTPSAPPTLQSTRLEVLGEDIADGLPVAGDGDYVKVRENALVRQTVLHRLITRRGEYRFHPEYGVGVGDWVKRAGSTASRKELKQLIIEQLGQDAIIERVLAVDVESVTLRGVQVLMITVSVQAFGRALKFEPFTFSEKT